MTVPKPNGQANDVPTPEVFALGATTSTSATTHLGGSAFEFKIVARPRTTESPNELEFVTPESLYKVKHGTVETTPIEGIKLLEIRKLCSEAIEHLDYALQETDLVARESILTLFNDIIFQLGHFISFSANLGRVIAALHGSVIQNLPSVYSEKQILALRRSLKLVQNNIFMSEKVMWECILIVSKDGGFDLSAPTAEADFYDDDVDE